MGPLGWEKSRIGQTGSDIGESENAIFVFDFQLIFH
jgi:hypothetical protein